MRRSAGLDISACSSLILGMKRAVHGRRRIVGHDPGRSSSVGLRAEVVFQPEARGERSADEYAADPNDKGPLGNADPRIEAIQVLKALNRAVYFSGSEIEPVFRRMRRWLLGSRMGSSPTT